MTVSENIVTLQMTPEETGKFSAGMPGACAIAQINLVIDGVRRATRPVRIPIYANLKAEAM